MIRGTRIFRCSECGKKFSGSDVEWRATAFSTPLTCPKCGSHRTLPLLALKVIYEPIWESMEKSE